MEQTLCELLCELVELKTSRDRTKEEAIRLEQLERRLLQDRGEFPSKVEFRYKVGKYVVEIDDYEGVIRLWIPEDLPHFAPPPGWVCPRFRPTPKDILEVFGNPYMRDEQYHPMWRRSNQWKNKLRDLGFMTTCQEGESVRGNEVFQLEGNYLKFSWR
jgi:hypothetical protein